MAYGSGDLLNGRLGLCGSVWRHKSKVCVCVGLACCHLSWTVVLSDDSTAEGVMCYVALY